MREHTPSRFCRLCLAGFLLIIALSGGEEVRALQTSDLNDSNIALAVERELRSDPGVAAHRVDVTTTRGQVSLSGTVDNLLAKERAARVARTVKGVRRVINNIEIIPPPRSERRIEEAVQTALMLDPATESYQIEVGVNQGRVTLRGGVESTAEKELAATVAKKVAGVTGLNNQLTIRLQSVRSSSEIATGIEQTLKWNPLVDHERISVVVSDGVVELSGSVGSASEKQEAVDAAGINGVQSIDAEQLRVVPGEGISARGPQRPLSDSEIRRAVLRKLSEHPRVETFEIEISVQEGTVLLSGQVDHLKAKQSAQWLARNTSGVWRVKNHLRVRPDDMPSDPSIVLDVRSAIKRNPLLGNDQIKVSVDNGKVTLSGTVDSLFEMREAADAASRVNGVIALNNNLRSPAATVSSFHPYVDKQSTVREYAEHLPPVASRQDDWEIAMDIRNELWWSPFVDRNQVDVQVHNGVAVLRGTVDSLLESSAAEENARQGGAAGVKNRLKIRQGPPDRQP